VISEDFGSEEDIKKSNQRIQDILLAYQHNPVPPLELPSNLAPVVQVHRVLSMWHQFLYLLVHNFKLVRRNTMALGFRIFYVVFLALVMGLVFQLKHGQNSITNREGLLFALNINQSISSVFQMIRTFASEKGVLARERASGTYQVAPFFMSRVLASSPFDFGTQFLLGIILYWLAGLRPNAGAFFIFLVTLSITSYTGQALGFFLGAAIHRPDVAGGVTGVLITIMLLFAGQLIILPSIPLYFIWLYYGNFVAYSYRALIINEFTGLTFTCDGASNSTCFKTGEAVIDFLGFDTGPQVGVSVAIVIAWTAFFLFCAYVTLRIRKPFPDQSKLRAPKKTI